MNRHPYGGYDVPPPPPRRRSASPPQRGYRGGRGRGGGRGGYTGGGREAPSYEPYNGPDSYGAPPIPLPVPPAPYPDYAAPSYAAPRDPYYGAGPGGAIPGGQGPTEYAGYDSYAGNSTGPESDYGGGRGGYENGGGRGGRGGAPYGGRGGGARPPRHRDDKVHDSIIEERVSRERPCRTLFIRNIKYESNSDRIRDKFEEHGEIKTFFDLIKNRGMVFVTYFDLRAAERARDSLQGMEIAGRPIDVHYSLPREHELSQRCDREKNQGTLLITLVGSQSRQAIDDNELRRKMQQFGDVKAIKPVFANGMMRHDQRFVEMFDSRACIHAHDRLRNQSLQDGLMELEFEWDIPDQPLPPGQSPISNARSPLRNDAPRGGPYRGPQSPRRNEWDDRRGYRDYPPSPPRGRAPPPPRDYPNDDFRRPADGPASSFPPITPIGDRLSAPYTAARGSDYSRDRFERDRRDDRPPYGGNNGGDRGRRDDWRGPPAPRRDSPPRGPPPLRGPDDYGRTPSDRGGVDAYGRHLQTASGSNYPPYPPPVAAPPPASGPVDDRLEQAKKVQQLLAALKPGAGTAAPASAPLPPPNSAPPAPYYGGAGPPPSGPPATYSGYPPPPGNYPPPSTYMGGGPPAPQSASAPIPGLPAEGVQNLLALLTQNQNQGGPR